MVEALARGKPVITTRPVGAMHIMASSVSDRHACGFLVDPDPHTLTACLADFLTAYFALSDREKDNMRKEARIRAHAFRWDGIVDELTSF